jgi:hypothetical protein
MREPWHHSGEVSYFHESNSKSSWEKCGELKICGRNGVLWVRLRDPVQSTGEGDLWKGQGLPQDDVFHACMAQSSVNGGGP